MKVLEKDRRKTRAQRWFPWMFESSSYSSYVGLNVLGTLIVAILVTGILMTMIAVPVLLLSEPVPNYECSYNEALIRAENGYRCVEARIPEVVEP